MSAGRLMGSYVVRVLVRNGVRSVVVHDIARAATLVLPDFAALAEHLERTSSGRPEVDDAAEGLADPPASAEEGGGPAPDDGGG